MYQQLQAMALLALAPADPNALFTAPVPAPKLSGITTNIMAGDNSFSPGKFTVVRGTTVVWTSQGAADAAYGSKALAPGASFAHIFGAPGVYPYYCQIHGGAHGEGMSGTIIVTDAPPAEL